MKHGHDHHKKVENTISKKNIEFINAALAGYTSFESYGRLWSRLRFYSPDLIIINHGWNEMYYFTENQVEDISKWRKLPDGDWTLDRQGEVLKIYEPLLLISFCSIPNFYQELECD